MKKLISIMLSLCFLFGILSGCSRNDVYIKSSDKISIIATIFAPYDFIREIAGQHAEVTMLLPPGTESHSYEPTPQDIIKIQNCDVFVYVGGDSDSWVQKILESMDTSGMRIIKLMDFVDVVEEEIVEGMEVVEHSDDDDYNHEGAEDKDNEHSNEHTEDNNHEYDEHVWTSPKNAKVIVQKISDVFCEIDANNSNIYKENTTSYLAKLNDLDLKFQEVVNSAKHRTLIFGDRFPFRYFADVYGLEYFAAFPGCSTETEASAATVAFLIDKVKSENIPVVFHAELSNKKMANTISEETGAKVLLLHACHNITKDEMEKNTSYLELMYQNVENLKEALK
jgi:ABC-type metal ion transport system, periplasmic component/surface adhesin